MAIWLNEDDVRALLPMGDLIATMETALRGFSGGQVRQPVREVIQAGAGADFFATMPAWLESGPAMGAKLVTVFQRNAERSLPSHQAAIVLFDAETGSLQAVMDGRYITEARTAAVSALALRALAAAGSHTLALIGSGVQTASHLRAFREVCEFRELRCWSPTVAHLRRFAAAHPPVRPVASAEEAVRGADVVVSVSASSTTVVCGDWVMPGACVIAVGACRPSHRELDGPLMARARVVVDSRAAALRESGELVMAMAEGHIGPDHIAAELGEVLSGSVAGRTAEDQVVVFKSLGLAVEDVAAARLAYGRAMAEGRGLVLA